MQLKDIRIDRFGACSSLSLDSLTGQLNVVHGPVGSGKTALFQFVRSILYGFDSATRQRYLPVDSRGFGGSLVIGDRDGHQTISRYDDGSVDGRLTIAHEDGTLIGRRHVPKTISDTSQTTFDRIFAVDHRRRPGIGALIEESQNCGFDLAGNVIDTDRIEKLDGMLRDLRDTLATVPRVEASHEVLCERRVELLRLIAALEARLASQTDETETRRRIEQIELQLSVVQSSLQRVRAELADAEQRRRALLARRQEPAKPLAATSSALAELRRVEQQLERWQAVLEEVVVQKQTVQQEAEGNTGPDIESNPRHWLSEAESQVDDLQAALQSLDDARTYHGRDVQQLFAGSFTALRANLYRLCNALNYCESSSKQRDCENELVHLARCETELRQSIQGLAARKVALQHEIATCQSGDPTSLVPWHDALCECADHPPLQFAAAARDRSPELDRQIEIVTQQIAARQHERDQLIAENDELESEIEDLRAELQRIGQVDLLEQLDLRRGDLRRVEQELRDVERRRQLLAEIASTEAELHTLRAASRESTIVTEAAECLRRLTSGDLRSIEIAANEQVWVTDENGRRRAYHQLPDGSRDLVYASLCLALAEAFRHRGIHLPLMISGLFTNVHSKNVPEAAELLRDFAARGHQVILFTRHEHVANVFSLLNVSIHELDAIAGLRTHVDEDREILTDEVDEMALAEQLWDSDEYSRDLSDRIHLDDLDSDGDIEELAGTANGRFLSEQSQIEGAPSIDAASAERLRKIGVLHVSDLLTLSADEVAADLRYTGITADTIRSWQAQSQLMCDVPRLRSYDARLLVACGITEADALYRMTPTDLRDQVKEMAASSRGQTVLLSGTEFELSRVTDWISASRSSSGSARGNRNSKQSERGERSRRDRSSSRRSRERSSSSRPLRDRGSRSPSDREARAESEVLRMKEATPESNWTFYLQRSDSVENAPSIGARTAERLDAVGVSTVADLLKADPEEVAEQIDNRRISASVIEQWQHQTQLAVRIPQLRGHDAQILVALDITEPEELAAAAPDELWSRVEPFVETKEGKRIIRNGKTPDLEEVNEWIQWAQAARHLNAA